MRRAAEKTGRKIAVVGSTSFAHDIQRGQEKWPSQEFMDTDFRFIDMLKAVDRGMTITDVRLLEKHGGKSGSYVAS